VPGRPSPRKEPSWGIAKVTAPGSATSSTAFRDYQESVKDAWEIGDDEFNAMSSELKISKKVAQTAALDVIHSHRTGNAQALDLPSTHKGSDHSDSNAKNSSNSGPSRLGNSSGERVTAMELANHRSVPQNQGKKFSSSKAVVICRTETESDKGKAEKIRNLLNSPTNTNLKELQSMSYSGLPPSVRSTAWKLLAGYLPTNIDRRTQVLERKREEYWACVKQYFGSRLDESHQDTFRQIHIDIPRMCPLIGLFQQTEVQEMFERILFIWAIRHPASGYVQGMNDLVTPFFVVFLEEELPKDVEVETFDVSSLPQDQKNNMEADSYWCMSKFLDSIQVNYIFAQTGIQEKVKKLKELIERIDAPLHFHLQKHEIDYLQFSFRWMNNLLMRELPLRCTIRLWDAYLSEPDGCGSVLLYVCAAFLRYWREELMKQQDFQGLMLLLQNLPTRDWDDRDMSLIVAESYRLKYTFDSAPKHLGS
jgi:hypothetical protein